MTPALREGGRSSYASQRLRSVLIVAQVSASFMLLIAAGLTLRSLMKVQSVDPGFRTENLLTLRADMSFDRIPLTVPHAEARRRRSVYWTEFEERLKALPGVIAVGGGGTFPLNDSIPFRTASSASSTRPARAARRRRSRCGWRRRTISRRSDNRSSPDGRSPRPIRRRAARGHHQ